MYNYQTEKPKLFTEEGQVKFLAVRDNVKRLIKTAGAVRMNEALSVVTGDTWEQIACVDRLVELGEIFEVTAGREVAGQHRIFSSRNT